MLAQWGQFIYEDMVKIESSQLIKGDEALPLACCETKHPECMPIFADPDDENYKGLMIFGEFNNLNVLDRERCLSYSRSSVSPRLNCELGAREQANMATSFLDASNLYGNSEEEARRLRSFVDGHLKTQTVDGEQLLPAKQMKSCANQVARFGEVLESVSCLRIRNVLTPPLHGRIFFQQRLPFILCGQDNTIRLQHS